jgi:uncharacterized protein YodC (DUF2158 family)
MPAKAATVQFQPGDLVRLESGGPTMTVVEIVQDLELTPAQGKDSAPTLSPSGNIGVHCEWFAGDALDNAVFSPAVLVPASPTAPKRR